MSGLLDVKDELCQGILDMNLGEYSCKFVTNIPLSSANKNDARGYFDLGLRYFFAYHHEDAYICFLKCIKLAPNCAFAHGLIALCHCPNYNFKGAAYYESTYHPEEEEKILADIKTNGGDITKRIFPSQQVATYHTRLAIEKGDELKKMNESLSEESEESSHMISELESQILSAIQILTSHPGIDRQEAESIVGRPYSDAMRKVYESFPDNAEVCYLFVESLMVLNAWKLYDYPTGKPLSKDVEEIETLLENALQLHPKHAGLCHMYVHLCEMSSTPEKALPVACQTLRTEFPHSGHLLHMPTHIDVLMGDYESCDITYMQLLLIKK